MTQVCIISYFASSSQGVGGIRARYWFDHLPELSSGKYQSHFVSGTCSENLNDRMVFIKPMFDLKMDQGIGWVLPLWLFLTRNSQKYDVFIFSCGPFLQLLLVPWIKLVLGKKVIIDYRDPFAINPVFNDSSIKKLLKKFFEIFFNLKADCIITVNKFCERLLQRPPGIRTEIIDNGYDETQNLIPVNRIDKNLTFVLAGGFSSGRDVTNFGNALAKLPGNTNFLHLSDRKLNLSSPSYRFLGRKDYSTTLGIIESSDIGVIFTSGHPYESTTKIFDYIRLNKKVVIVADEVSEPGSLHEITSGFSNIVWVENTESSILQGLHHLISMPELKFTNIKNFSREHGLLKLINILDTL